MKKNPVSVRTGGGRGSRLGEDGGEEYEETYHFGKTGSKSLGMRQMLRQMLRRKRGRGGERELGGCVGLVGREEVYLRALESK